MREFLKFILFFLLLPCAVAQPPASSSKPIGYSTDGTLQPAGFGTVELKHSNNTKQNFSPTANTDLARGVSLSAAFSALSDGDEITTSSGTFQVAATLAVKTGVTWRGDSTTVKFSDQGATSYGGQEKSVVSGSASNLSHVRITGVNFDNNLQAQTATDACVAAVVLTGSDIVIEDCSAINWGSKNIGIECFVFSIFNVPGQGNGISYGNKIRNCRLKSAASTTQGGGTTAFSISGQGLSGSAVFTPGDGWIGNAEITGCSIDGVTEGTSSGQVNYFHGYGLASAISSSVHDNFAYNLVRTGTASGDCSAMYTDTWSQIDVRYSHNTFINVWKGFYIQLNSPYVLTNVLFDGNYVVSAGTSGACMSFSRASGTLSGMRIKNNVLISAVDGIDLVNVNNFAIEDNTIDAGTLAIFLGGTHTNVTQHKNYNLSGAVVGTPTAFTTAEAAGTSTFAALTDADGLVMYDDSDPDSPKIALSNHTRGLYDDNENLSILWAEDRQLWGASQLSASWYDGGINVGGSGTNGIIELDSSNGGDGIYFVGHTGGTVQLTEDGDGLFSGNITLRGLNFSDSSFYNKLLTVNSGGSVLPLANTSAALAGFLSDPTGFTTGAQAVFNINPIILRPLSAMAELVIDVTKINNTKSIAASTTFTLSATPSSGTTFGVIVTTDSTARVVTLPSGTWKSEARGGATITTLTIPASSSVTLIAQYEGSSTYRLYGEPLTINDLTIKATPIGADSVSIYDSVAGIDSKATITSLSTAFGGAPTSATYITQTHDSTLSAEQAMGDLATGIVKNTTTTGVQSIAAAGTDYVAPSGTLAIAGFGSVTGTLAVANGGTNLASYAVGDILYASGSTTIAKLADVATGSVLASGGVTTAPVWTANPALASLTIGGNQSVSAWTTNGVQYKTSASTLTDGTSSGTVAAAYTNKFGGNTIAAGSATTYTNYIGSYFTDPVAGTNATFTNKYALGTDSLKAGTSNALTISTTGVLTAVAPILGAATATSYALTNGGIITDGGTGAITLTASGTNQNITLTPSGTGKVTTPAAIVSSGKGFSIGDIFTATFQATGSNDIYLDTATSARNIIFSCSSTSSNSTSIATSSGGAGGLRFNNQATLAWTSSATDPTSTKDIAFGRNAAGVVEVNSSTAGTYRDIKVRSVLAGDATKTIQATATNDSAAAGFVGEYSSSLIASGSAVGLTTATAANVTSISLTAGDWDVEGNVNFTETVATATARSASIGTTSATLATDGSEVTCGVQSTLVSEVNSITVPRKRISISGTTTVYLVASANFSAGTVSSYGGITARRIR